MLSSEFQSIKIKKASEAIAVKTMVVNNTAFFFFLSLCIFDPVLIYLLYGAYMSLCSMVSTTHSIISLPQM